MFDMSLNLNLKFKFKFGPKVAKLELNWTLASLLVILISCSMAQRNCVYNTSGLQNQAQKALKPVENTPIIHEDEQTNDKNWDANLQWDSLKSMLGKEDEEEGEIEEWDVDSNVHLNSKGLHVRLVNWAIENGDDPQDEDWIPPTLQAKSRKQRGLKQQLKGKTLN